MTDNTQELDVILEDFYDGDIRQSDMGKAKQAILDWHNKQIEAALNRLVAAKDSEGRIWAETIEAERNKLKESSNA